MNAEEFFAVVLVLVVLVALDSVWSYYRYRSMQGDNKDEQ